MARISQLVTALFLLPLLLASPGITFQGDVQTRYVQPAQLLADDTPAISLAGYTKSDDTPRVFFSKDVCQILFFLLFLFSLPALVPIPARILRVGCSMNRRW